jgi:hypothetical protein
LQSRDDNSKKGHRSFIDNVQSVAYSTLVLPVGASYPWSLEVTVPSSSNLTIPAGYSSVSVIPKFNSWNDQYGCTIKTWVDGVIKSNRIYTSTQFWSQRDWSWDGVWPYNNTLPFDEILIPHANYNWAPEAIPWLLQSI